MTATIGPATTQLRPDTDGAAEPARSAGVAGSAGSVASSREVTDANDAVARIAHRCSEVIAIYPITPASSMAEACDAWSNAGRTNLWGEVPEVIQMQSEAGAAGTLHGAVTRGALGTTFTASQGLLLMLPNMFKIAGELTPAVIHVTARTVATHALSIFGDHSDVMAARTTGFAMLAASSVQEAADFALVAHAATLDSRVPFLHFFDGFRTSHEINTIEPPTDATIRTLIDDTRVAEHRLRALDPNRPVLRGSAQNPDVFFQAREAANPMVDAVPAVVAATFDRLADLTGRRYGLVDYHGAPDAERVVVLMGSGVGAATEAVDALNAQGAKVGVLCVRLYRPFAAAALLAALPTTVRAVAVLDRTKEPGAGGEPLYLDVVEALATAADTAPEHAPHPMPRVIGGRYGLSSKEFTPAMAAAVFAELDRAHPKRRFTVGIVDDVTHLSLSVDTSLRTDHAALRAVFYGLGSDGTVGANKATAKIVGTRTPLHAQGYFVYDSKKSGSTTVSHLRFADHPIGSTYLIEQADLVAVHQFALFERLDVLHLAKPGATLLVNSPWSHEHTWDHLPHETQQTIVERGLQVFTIDAHRVARDAGLAGQINTIMQVAFFAVTDLLPLDEAIAAIDDSIAAAYGKRGSHIVDANRIAVHSTVAALRRMLVPATITADHRRPPAVPDDAPDFVQRVTAMMIAGQGDLLPVSALPVDGTFPTATSRHERRHLATEIPVWDPSICIDCARCALVCPHAAIRVKIYDPAELELLDGPLPSKAFRSANHPGLALTVQVVPDGCTGCGVCVDVCPARSKHEVKHKAIDMLPIAEHGARELEHEARFERITPVAPGVLDPSSVKGSQTREPLFEFSGACAGCGETPYLKLMSQLFGDRTIVANATGCSSIYGGNLPTTPWATDAAGRGPAWSNSLFEDNAEFGLGIRIALDAQTAAARRLLGELHPWFDDVLDDVLDATMVDEILAVHPDRSVDDATMAAQRDRIARLDAALARIVADGPPEAQRIASHLAPLTSTLARIGVWIVGGDGWAYDIGAGGLDHVLGSGRDVNILVLDTEVYSNTGGQASKATSRGAVAKFAAGGKAIGKKDLAAEAMRYGDVYVAQVAVGANDVQTVRAFAEAEAWPGPSLIIAYSTCIAHGIDMTTSMTHQKSAVASGYWPLFRYRPGVDEHTHPFQLDSNDPSIALVDFTSAEGRFAMLQRSDPERAAELMTAAQADVDERWRYYRQLAGIERTMPYRVDHVDDDDAAHDAADDAGRHDSGQQDQRDPQDGDDR